MLAGACPVPKYQFGNTLLKRATMSGAGSSWRPASLFAIASTYQVSARGAPEKSRQMKLGPAEPRMPIPSGSKLASTVMVTGELTFCAQILTARWNAVRAAALKPV